MTPLSLSTRVAARFLQASYFSLNDIVLYGKYKNHRGKIVGFGKDKWGNPTIEIEPIPKGRKKNKEMGLFKIWRADVKEKALAELEKHAHALNPTDTSPLPLRQAMNLRNRVATRFVQAEGIPLGKTWETGTVRIHRYLGSFRITDLTNAGKRGKKVKEMSIGLRGHNDQDPWYDNMAKMLAHVKSYDEVSRLIRDVQKDYPNEINMNETELRGVDVNPGGTTKITLSHKTEGGSIEITAEPHEFLVKSTHLFEGMGENKDKSFTQDTTYYSRKKESAAVFYNWLKANLSEAGKMDITDLRKLWSDLGVRYDYH